MTQQRRYNRRERRLLDRLIQQNARQDTGVTIDKVEDAFDPKMLQDYCEAPEENFHGMGDLTHLSNAPAPYNYYVHIRQPGARVLGVAHLDSVSDDRACSITDTAAGPVVHSRTLDDRLGAYVIADLLPRLGITCDVLLTTGEEVGQSTARYFKAPKGTKYDWMFSFDRAGTDVVLYDYETTALRARVQAAGGRVGVGSFSDICWLEHLGVQGANWGVGYRDYHGPRAHAYLDDTFAMVVQFARFYDLNWGLHLHHEPWKVTNYRGCGSSSRGTTTAYWEGANYRGSGRVSDDWKHWWEGYQGHGEDDDVLVPYTGVSKELSKVNNVDEILRGDN